MSKSTTVNKNGFTPFPNGGCQSLSTRMGSHPLLMMHFKVYYTVNKNGFTPFANVGCQSLQQSTRMDLHPFIMVDVKVYYSQQEYIAAFAESVRIYKLNECIPENVFITCKSTMNVYAVEISI